MDTRSYLARLTFAALIGCGASHTGSGAEFLIFGTDDPPEEEAPCPLPLEDDDADDEGCPQK